MAPSACVANARVDVVLPSSTPLIHSYNRGNVLIKTLHRGSTQAEVTQVIANSQSVIHGYNNQEYIDPLFASEFGRMLQALYLKDSTKRLECRYIPGCCSHEAQIGDSRLPELPQPASILCEEF